MIVTFGVIRLWTGTRWPRERISPLPAVRAVTSRIDNPDMTKLKKAHVPESESTMLIKDLHKKWLENDEAIRQSFATHDVWIALAMIEDYVKNEMAVHDQWKNELYQVAVRKCGPDAVHLSIKRNDRKPIHDWRDLQEIKNQLVGEECEGVELYPAESRRVDSANQYHIFCITDPKFRFGFGFNERLVTETQIGKSVNRPI